MTDESNATNSNYRAVEYRMMGYLVRGRVPRRLSLNPLGQFFAANHDCNTLEDYLVEYLETPDPQPHTFKLDAHPPMTITEITPTNVTSLWDEARIRGKVVIP
jgi:hypothetical protein